MKRIVVAALLAFAVSAVVATAAPGSEATKSAGAACNALKAKIGPTAFAQAYATFGRCVSTMAQVEQQNLTSAQAACTVEQSDVTFATSHGSKTFDQFYGTGKNARNAFGNCVSAKAQASSKAEGQDRPNPARTCRAERTLMGAGQFGVLYGKGANDRNAFGKCVAKAAHVQTLNELSASAVCRAEQGDASFAAAHSGKTFTQFYGTGPDLSNGFGKCVSSKAADKGQSQQQAKVAAAKACWSERTANPSAFRTKYGTFGHCVSLKASGK